MKRITAILTVLSILTVSMSVNTHAVNAASVSTTNTVTVIVDGRKIDFPDAPAFIDENGRTQLPARFIGEAQGAHVAWDEEARKVTISRRSAAFGEGISHTVFMDLYIGSEVYYTRVGREGRATRHTMDTKAVIEQQRTYVPVRYVAETLGAKVDWDARTRTVTITSETKQFGDFVVPKSCTDSVTRGEDELKAVSFRMDIREPIHGFTNFANRTEIVFEILSQKLGQDTIDKISEFMINGKTFSNRNPSGNEFEIIFDSKSGQYVDLVSQAGTIYFINIYDEGYLPLNYEYL